MKKTVEDVARELVADGIGNPYRDKSTGRYSSGGGGMTAAPIGGEPTNFASRMGYGGMGSEPITEASLPKVGQKITFKHPTTGEIEKGAEVRRVHFEPSAPIHSQINVVTQSGGHIQISPRDLPHKQTTTTVMSKSRPTSEPSGHRISNTPVFNSAFGHKTGGGLSKPAFGGTVNPYFGR